MLQKARKASQLWATCTGSTQSAQVATTPASTAPLNPPAVPFWSHPATLQALHTVRLFPFHAVARQAAGTGSGPCRMLLLQLLKLPLVYWF
jgi:hypothetical protein